MPSHPIDFFYQAELYSTGELAALFDEKARFARWLLFEATLAAVQGEAGIIPEAAAREIGSKSTISCLDLEAVRQGYSKSRNSLMPVVKALKGACVDNHGEYVHFGATTQDVLDTGHVLEMKEVISILLRDARVLEGILIELARDHRRTPMIGRTHGQHALPITFGMKVAVWLAEIRRHIERLRAVAPRVLVGQLSGAVGTMAALGPSSGSEDVARKVMSRLGLGYSPVAWHTSRDCVAELASMCALLTATCEKIAGEIIQLGKTEIAELREPAPVSAMSSSTMPHKRNPVFCQRIAVLARHVRALSGVVVESMIHEHERDARALWSEWLAMPQISIYTGTALHYLISVVRGLEVCPEKMLANLHLHRELVASERLLFRLGAHLGKMTAQERLHAMIRRSEQEKRSLKEMLSEDKGLGPLLTEEDHAYLDRPELYVGRAVEIVDAVVRESVLKRKSDPEEL